MAILTGEQFAQYKLGPRLGRGSLGAVYEAYDEAADRPVAIKIVLSRLARQERFRQRFLRLGNTAVQLRHPAIVPVYDVQYRLGKLFMVMAVVKGITLHNALAGWGSRQPLLALPDALHLAMQLAQALDHAHAHGMIHRALSPVNIFLQPDPAAQTMRPFITDFGMTALLNGVDRARSLSFVRSLPYLSPEQVLMQPVDGRADLYALGVLLYRLVTGRLPFVLDRPGDVVIKHLHETPRPPLKAHPGLPRPLNGLIMKLLAKRPADRYQNGAQAAAALHALAAALTPETTAVYEQNQPVVRLIHLAPHSRLHQLTIAAPGEPVRSLALDRPVWVIGRSRRADCVLPAAEISRRHCRLLRHGDAWQITDLGSKNGTFLNETRLPPHRPHPWPAGHELCIGPYRLRWQ